MMMYRDCYTDQTTEFNGVAGDETQFEYPTIQEMLGRVDLTTSELYTRVSLNLLR
jgi:hypothetical protein